jgi:hypothetical protein
LPFLVVLLLPVSVGAAPADDAIRIEWMAPPVCPTQADVRKIVDAMLRGTRTPNAARSIVARGIVVEDGQSASLSAARPKGADSNARSYTLELSTETDGTKGQRTLASASCSELATAAALIVALAYDPEAVQGAGEPEPVNPVNTGNTVDTVKPTVSVHEQVTPEERVFRFGAGLSVVGDVGSVPNPDLGFALSAGLLFRHLRLETSGALWLRQSADASGEPGKGGRFDFVTGSISGCGRMYSYPLELDACALLELGRMSAYGYGVSDPGANALFWIAPGVMGRMMLPVAERLAFGVCVGFVVPLSRPPWTLTNIGTVDRASPICARGSAGAEVRF